jgi:protein-S-isoprenylcysteine O-methyltransferase
MSKSTMSNGSTTATQLADPTLTHRSTSSSTSNSAATTQSLPPAHVFQTSPSSSGLSLEARHYIAHNDIPNTILSVSIISTILGGILFTSFTLVGLSLSGWIKTSTSGDFDRAEWGMWARPQLGVYFGCMALFHLSEFWTTAGWNKDRLSVDGESSQILLSYLSVYPTKQTIQWQKRANTMPIYVSPTTPAFLLNNGNGYILAHVVGLVEYFAWSYFWPRQGSWWITSGWLYVGTSRLQVEKKSWSECCF